MSDETNPKDLLGIKKAPLRLVPPALLIETAPALTLGAEKYGPYNWREKDVRLTVYLEALLRHVLAYADRQDLDPESGASHLSHASACLAIIFDAKACGRLVDDRFTAGAAAELLAAQDRSKATTADKREMSAEEYRSAVSAEIEDHWAPAERRQPQQLVTKCDVKSHTPLPHFHHAELRSHRIVGEDGELVGKEWCGGECPTTLSHVMTSRGWEAVAPECGEDARCGGDGQCEFHDDAESYTELVEYRDEVARALPRGKRDGRNCGPGNVHAHDRYCAHNDDRTDDEVLADVTRRYP